MVVVGLRVNNEPVEALTRIVRRGKADALGRQMVRTMKEEIERQVFDVILQASHGPTTALLSASSAACPSGATHACRRLPALGSSRARL